MPLYMFNTETGALTDGQRAGIAADLTRIYCDVTGAPALFVNAFFFENLPIIPLDGVKVSILAGTRKGWSDGQKAEIVDRLKLSISHRAEIAGEDVRLIFHDTPASWAMEGGDIVPEPGEEAAWLAAREARSAAATV